MVLSFVIPVYHGEQTVQPLFAAILKACKEYNYQFEVVFIWDCGPDKSWEKILELKASYPSEIKAIRLSRNFGQHNAIICGFANARGDLMVTMDEDLQHNPGDVKLLVEKQKEGDYDIVYGHYPDRQHNGFRNFTSRLLKKLLEFGIPDLHKDYSAYRIIKRDIALATIDMQNSYTFLDGYFSWITTNVGSVLVSHNRRLGGVSSYSMKKLVSHSVNIFVTFSDLPIKLVTYLSLLFFVFTFGYAIYILLQKLIFNNLVPGFASMIVLLGFGIGSILFGISVLGEYIHRINLKTTRRPNFRISEIL
jgi:undecaprenyl-phosphate 4-deoxy-4-formamido-L-arabinose transferase